MKKNILIVLFFRMVLVIVGLTAEAISYASNGSIKDLNHLSAEEIQEIEKQLERLEFLSDEMKSALRQIPNNSGLSEDQIEYFREQHDSINLGLDPRDVEKLNEELKLRIEKNKSKEIIDGEFIEVIPGFSITLRDLIELRYAYNSRNDSKALSDLRELISKKSRFSHTIIRKILLRDNSVEMLLSVFNEMNDYDKKVALNVLSETPNIEGLSSEVILKVGKLYESEASRRNERLNLSYYHDVLSIKNRFEESLESSQRGQIQENETGSVGEVLSKGEKKINLESVSAPQETPNNSSPDLKKLLRSATRKSERENDSL